MCMKKAQSRHGFRLIEEKIIPEIHGTGRMLQHEATQIKVLALQNKDVNKVFSITFKTLPDNNKGAAHIVEHAVCCASQKYPLKETFVALGQGSICTTMNACTYPDRTMYYAASPNEKDLLGLLGVYLDLVFHPAITTNSTYFLQEGWHYDLEDLEQSLEVSGVVYHEMLGEYGEASAYLQYHELAAMFEDNCYQYDAGGLPESIIQLTEAEFLAFYHQYYVGSNAVITLYGDYDLDHFLEVLDTQYLKEIPVGKIAPAIVKQPPFKKPRYQQVTYPTALEKAPTLASLCFAVGSCIDPKERLGLEMLEHMLLRSTASPLLEALVLKAHLGISLSDGGYDSCRLQPVFSIVLKGTTQEKAPLFEKIVLSVLEQLAAEGIDPKLIDAAIETLEFELKETDDSYEPIGILYSEMMVNSLYGGGGVFDHLSYSQAMAEIKKACHTGYFEELIKRYFLHNNHRLLTVIVPDEQGQIKKEEHLTQTLAACKAAMSQEELLDLIALNERLNEEQLKENSEALLLTLPHLTLADLPDTLETLSFKEVKVADTSVQLHEAETKGICYFHFLWQAEQIPYEYWHTLGLLAHIFTYIGTAEKTYSEVENAINTYTGSMSVAIHAYQEEKTFQTLPVFKVSCKVLCHHLSAFQALITELFTKTQFKEKEKLRELIGHIVYEMERSFSGAPEYRAVQRLYTALSPEGAYEDEVAGLSFYYYMKEINENFDAQYETLTEALTFVLQQLMVRQALKISVTYEPAVKTDILQMIETFLTTLPVKACDQSYSVNEWYHQQPAPHHEGFINGQDGQAIAKGFCYGENGKAYKGQLEVVANVLENTYLWDRIRLQGGAYGCDIMLTKEGYFSVCSYCDPHLRETLETFDAISDYLSKLQLSDTAIERAVISTLGAMLVPASMEQKSERACTYFITGGTQKMRQQIYDEIKQTTLQDFHDAASLLKDFKTKGIVCVMGSKERLEEEKNHLTLIDLKI